MNIAVIGDYESPQYQELLQIVKIAFPDDNILDLSTHQKGDYKAREKARQNLIKGAFMFIYDHKWEESTEIRQDITYAQKAGLDGYLYAAGQFRACTSVYRKS